MPAERSPLGPLPHEENLRALLARSASEGPLHALVLLGNRSAAHLVAEDLWARAHRADRLLVAVGRRLLAPHRGEVLNLPEESLLHLPEPGAGEPPRWERRLAEAQASAVARGYAGMSVLAAPGPHHPGGLEGLDAALDAAGLMGAADRFCVYPVAWLRHGDPLATVRLVKEHHDTAVLP
jgi:hypothetical protein